MLTNKMASQVCRLHGPLTNGTCEHCDEEDGVVNDAEEVGAFDLPDFYIFSFEYIGGISWRQFLQSSF